MMTVKHQLRHKQALALVAIVAGLAPAGVVAASRYARPTPGKLKADIGAHSHGRGATTMGSVSDQVEPDGISKARGCTMAVPPARATVEAGIANAGDFCELVLHALATDVFRSPVLLTPGVIWHYAGATMSCHLRYAHTRQWVTIHNSSAACLWLRRLAPEWRVETLATAPTALAE
jgi:hypothetical protein